MASGVSPVLIQDSDLLFRAGDQRPPSEGLSALLLFHGDTWCHRVVAKLQVIDEGSLRWAFSNDFTVPSSDSEHDSSESFTFHAPLIVVPKKKIADVDIVDEQRRTLPALGREEEVTLLLDSVLQLWREYTVGELKNRVLRIVERLPEGGSVVTTTSVESVLAELIAFGPQKAMRRLQWIRASNLLAEIADDKQRRYFDAVLRTLVFSGVLFGTIQHAHPGERRIIKVSFRRPTSEVSLESHRRRIRDRRGATRWDRIQARLDLVLQSIGVRSTPFIWRLPTTRGSSSYHFEATAPDGLMFIDSLLTDGSHFSALVRNRRWSERFHVERLDSGDPCARHIHLYRRHDDNDSELVHALYLRTPPVAWLLSALVATFFVALGLTFVAVDINHLAGVDRATTVASGMLALGAVAVVALVRPLEHSFTSKVLRGARVAVGLSATAALVAIAYLLQVRAPTSPTAAVRVGAFSIARWYCVSAVWLASATLLAVFLSWPFSNRRLKRVLKRQRASAKSGSALAP